MKSKLYISSILVFLFFGDVCAQAPDWVWAKSAPGTTSDFAMSMAIDENGNSYITGHFSSPTITFGSITLANSSHNRFRQQQ